MAAAFLLFFGAAAFPLGAAALGAVSFGEAFSFLGSDAASGCVAARRLRSGFAVDAAAVTHGARAAGAAAAWRYGGRGHWGATLHGFVFVFAATYFFERLSCCLS